MSTAFPFFSILFHFFTPFRRSFDYLHGVFLPRSGIIAATLDIAFRSSGNIFYHSTIISYVGKVNLKGEKRGLAGIKEEGGRE